MSRVSDSSTYSPTYPLHPEPRYRLRSIPHRFVDCIVSLIRRRPNVYTDKCPRLCDLVTIEIDTWTRRIEIYNRSDLTTYMLAEEKGVLLTHDYGGSLKVWVKPFIPVDGDVTSYIWTDREGNEREQLMPYYALAGLENTKKTVNGFIDQNLHGYLRAHLDFNSFLVWGVFRLALRRAATGNASNRMTPF